MKIAICDDSKEELFQLSSLLEKYNLARTAPLSYESFSNATDLLEAMKLRSFDLLFLDILMPGLSGMDAAREIRLHDKQIPIVFLTSSPEFAVESYRVHAEDYILKPAQQTEVFSALDTQLARIHREDNFLTLKTKDSLLRLPLSEIVCVEVASRKLRFTLINGETKEVYGYLSDYEDTLLADSRFWKSHRSYIVNLQQVSALDKAGFTTTINITVPISRNLFVEAKTIYMKYLLGKGEV